MANVSNRRTFLAMAAGGTLSGIGAGVGDLGFLGRLPRVAAAETEPAPAMVQFQPEIEPLVRLLEETPRERLLEEVAGRIRAGLSYRELLAALQLAGVRNVQPRPVGFKFHAVLVVNSAHLASQSSPDEHRWLPIFWALDAFKASQAQDVQEGDWTMAPVAESAVPKSASAMSAFTAAMDQWDEAAADAAVAGVARTHGAGAIYEQFFRYGARDFRAIGHKAIFVANSWRTLQCIGWQHSEPVVRSLAYALLAHEGASPATRDDEADRPWRKNIERAGSLRPDWRDGATDEGATREMLVALRSGGWEETTALAAEMLGRGVGPQSLWDAALLGAAELVGRQPAIGSLHAVTTSNALRFAYEATASDETRKMMLLQNVAFLPMFRQFMERRGQLGDFQIDQLTGDEAGPPGPDALGEAFAEMTGNREQGARKIATYLRHGGSAESVISMARLLVFLKGHDSHDYKFSSAAIEEYRHLSPRWRDAFLAASTYLLRSAGEPDNQLVARTRAALSVARPSAS